MLIDYAKIKIRAGKGGDGSSSFHREKFVPRGGPDGGNGGRGGDVIFESDRNIKTLIDFKYKRNYTAENAVAGQSNNKTGKSGEDTIIKIPVGTVIKNAETNAVIADLNVHGLRVVGARGGAGGRGNTVFKSATHQSPDYCEFGLLGEEKEIILELKLLADVAVIGLPNAGKSTLLSVISAAKPKIADYPFTTLTPNLGVVKVDDDYSFTVADIPGLIENAHTGAGLGLAFLKHIERSRFLVHLIDVNSDDLIMDFEIINNELNKYSEILAGRSQIVVITKTDTLPDYRIITSDFENYIKEKSKIICLMYISSSANLGVRELIFKIRETLELPEFNIPQTPFIAEKEYKLEEEKPLEAIKLGEGSFEIKGGHFLKIITRMKTSTDDGLIRLNKLMEQYNINFLLKNAGAQNGDRVYIGSNFFDYYED